MSTLCSRRACGVGSCSRGCSTLITQYNHKKHAMKLGEVMHSNVHLLPPYLATGQFILAYRAAPKLDAKLVTYRFPRKEKAHDT